MALHITTYYIIVYIMCNNWFIHAWFDFLFIYQALWRCLRNSNDSIAHVAFRVLGKFGGGNRKMLREPQGLTFNTRPLAGPSITVHFQDCKQAIQLPVEKVIKDENHNFDGSVLLFPCWISAIDLYTGLLTYQTVSFRCRYFTYILFYLKGYKSVHHTIL